MQTSWVSTEENHMLSLSKLYQRGNPTPRRRSPEYDNDKNPSVHDPWENQGLTGKGPGIGH